MKPNPTTATTDEDVEISDGHASSTSSLQKIPKELLLTTNLRYPLGAKDPSSADETWESSAPEGPNSDSVTLACQLEK